MKGSEKQVKYAEFLIGSFLERLEEVELGTLDRQPERMDFILETFWRLRESITRDRISGSAGDLIEEFRNVSYSDPVKAVKEILQGRLRSGKVKFG